MCVCAILAVDACTQYITPCVPQCGDSALHSVSMHFEFNPSELQPSIIHWKLQNCRVACWLLALSLVHEDTGSSLNIIFFTFHVFTLQNTTQRESVCVCVTFIAHLLGRVLEVCTLH